ncbi:helix-turn-helix domain-containing protein [Corynebacterium hadale]|uniref:helix-turn-helix domain-containing protein n=1 Tax=Corynebacterium hadale TaxID=2026255 RepID=UPI000BAA46FC|nr:helix-turn-helix domain-containing protein [Corynebacterium hadale]PAT11648.1 hypothetical protein CKJ83_10560 [Corynebacterium hadale]
MIGHDLNEDQWLTYKQAATLYKVGRRTLQRLRTSGKVRSTVRYSQKRQVYLNAEDLKRMLGKPLKQDIVRYLLGELPDRYHAVLLQAVVDIDEGRVTTDSAYSEEEAAELERKVFRPSLDELLANVTDEYVALLDELGPPEIPEVDNLEDSDTLMELLNAVENDLPNLD